MDARTVEWGYRCQDCHRARKYGARKLHAEIQAGKHARKYDWHTVELTKTEVVHVFTARGNMNTLLNDSEPPF